MKIDILELINGKKDKMEIHTDISREKFNFNEKEITFAGPMDFYGSIRRKKENFILKGVCEVLLTCPCDRCLEEASFHLKFEVEEQYSRQECDQDLKLIVNNSIDLYEVVEEHLYLNMPLQILCKDDCKGLCHNCGINLNKGNCNCCEVTEQESSEPDLDPRFSKLKGLFK